MIRRHIISLAALLMGAVSISSAREGQIWVNPQGDDLAVGDESHPVRTVKAACDRARNLAAAADGQTVITINIAEGEYTQTSPIVFSSKDWGREDVKLVIKGAGMSRTVISGGVVIPQFKVQPNGVWTSDLSAIMPCGGNVRQLFINGRRAVLARQPNEGSFYKTPKVSGSMVDSLVGVVGGSAQAVWFKLPADASAFMNGKVSGPAGNMVCAVFHAWDASRRYVESYNPKTSIITLVGGVISGCNPMGNCSQFIFEGHPALLDAPGEFYFDEGSAVLSYIPREGETPENVTAIVPGCRQLVVVKGTADKPACDISFEGISFRYTRHILTWRGEGPVQAAATVDGSVMLDYARGIRFDSCEVSCTGNNAICFNEGCHDCSVTGCYLHDLGTGAVKVGGFNRHQNDSQNLTSHITVDNNIMRDGSRSFECGTGVLLLNASDCEITHNDISDFYYSGVSTGWTWGYGFSPTKRNKVEFNHIHHLGWGVLSDMGGVYTLGMSEGSTVSNNVIHDIYSYGYGGWGLYTDEGSTGIIMENNLVYRCKSSGFHQHYGEENIIRNNVFVDNMVAQLQATRQEDHTSFHFTSNVVCYNTGDLYLGNWNKVKADVDSNIYWNEAGKTDFNGMDQKAWLESTGRDAHSLLVDPECSREDFSLGNRRALKKIGFKPFDITRAGVYGDESWKQLAEYPSERDALYQKTVADYLAADKESTVIAM